MNIGERIKKCRKNRGLTQEKLSELLKISPMTVRRWEWGKRKPDIDIMPISKYIEYFCSGSNGITGLSTTV